MAKEHRQTDFTDWFHEISGGFGGCMQPKRLRCFASFFGILIFDVNTTFVSLLLRNVTVCPVLACVKAQLNHK